MRDALVLGQEVLNPTPQYQYVRIVRTSALHPCSLALMACWRAHEEQGGMRMGRDIPSRPLVKLLPHILITEPINQWSDARIRLAGTAMMERFGRDIAGHLASQVFVDDPKGATLLLELGRRASETREPTLVDSRIFVDGIEKMHLEIVLMPIYSADGADTWSLVGAFKF